MYGSDYAWILHGGPSDIWWENVTECPQHHLSAAVEGLLLVSSHNSIVGVMPSYSGLVSRLHSFGVEKDNLTTVMTQLSCNLGSSTSWNPQGLCRDCFTLLSIDVTVRNNSGNKLLHSTTRQAMYIWHNLEALSCKYYCSGKANEHYTTCACIFVALGFHCLINSTIFKKKITEHKMCVLSFFATFVWNIFNSN